ncbi:MAG: tRNA epoxyqueuosine(34) reductase QueG [Planctomycetaceae bacterium]
METPATTPQTPCDADHQLTAELKRQARDVGFNLCGVASAIAPITLAALDNWLAQGFAGEMQYIERRRTAYDSAVGVLPGCRSVVMLAMNYHTAEPISHQTGQGRIARYAWGTGDYHDLLRVRLKQLANWLQTRVPGCRTRGVVDTAPLLERDFARLAGLGWFGKNTMLINKRLGSWLFLAALLTDVKLPADAPHETAHCGTCTRCLDACPTNAFPEPYVLDATRCISYWTIEHRGPIPEEMHAGIGNWLFGCDICNDVCPWNRKAPASTEPAFAPQPSLNPVNARELLSLSADEFHKRYGTTPLSRPGHTGLQRNAAIVVANAESAVTNDPTV